MSESVDNRQIAPIGRICYKTINIELPLSIAESVITKQERKLTLLWPPVTDMPFFKVTMAPFFHSHKHFELIYVLEGTFTHHLENSIYVMNAGDAILLNSRIRHFEGDETECRCLYLNFLPEFLNSLFSENAVSAGKKQHTSIHIMNFCMAETATGSVTRAALTIRKKISADSDEANKIKTIFKRILALLKDSTCGYAYFVQGYLLMLFECFENPSLYHITHIETISDTASVLFADINHYIAERNGRISRQELSALLHYNPDYLSRIIRRESGMSFTEYCKSVWLEKAKYMLTSTDISINEIITALGFESGNSFYKSFKEKTGLTPKEYRKRYRRDNMQSNIII